MSGSPLSNGSDRSSSVICQHYGIQTGEYPRGIIALDPATGHELRRGSDVTNNAGSMDMNFGE